MRKCKWKVNHLNRPVHRFKKISQKISVKVMINTVNSKRMNMKM